jgi:hypothetical protein
MCSSGGVQRSCFGVCMMCDSCGLLLSIFRQARALRPSAAGRLALSSFFIDVFHEMLLCEQAVVHVQLGIARLVRVSTTLVQNCV